MKEMKRSGRWRRRRRRKRNSRRWRIRRRRQEKKKEEKWRRRQHSLKLCLMSIQRQKQSGQRSSL